MPLTLDHLVQSRRSILKLLHTVHYRFAKTSMILACWLPRWRPCGPSVEVAHVMKSSILVNCLWSSACSCRVAPIHFRPPSGGPVLSLHVCVPLPVPCRPPAKGPACNEVDLLSREPAWGSARSSHEAHIHFQPYFTA
jgi:hypothetical protein